MIIVMTVKVNEESGRGEKSQENPYWYLIIFRLAGELGVVTAGDCNAKFAAMSATIDAENFACFPLLGSDPSSGQRKIERRNPPPFTY